MPNLRNCAKRSDFWRNRAGLRRSSGARRSPQREVSWRRPRESPRAWEDWLDQERPEAIMYRGLGARESYRGRRISSGSALSEQLKRYRGDGKSTFGELWAKEEAGLEAERARVASSLVSDQRGQSDLRSKCHTIGDKWDKRCLFLAGGAGPY